MDSRTFLVLLAGLVLAPVAAQPAQGQSDSAELGSAEALQLHHPELLDLIDRLEQTHAMLFNELIRWQGDVPPSGGGSPTDLEADAVELLANLAQSQEFIVVVDEPFSPLGFRAAEVIRWGHAFQREVLSILADPDVVDPKAALADALSRYRTRPGTALPSVPKNMDVLYDHDYALAFRTNYADLDGLAWAGHWLRLAATEPLTDLPSGPERAAAMDTVLARYHAKLTYGEPPHSFPSELPLAPAIAPGLIWLSPESAMIWDNLSMLLEVLADVLASHETTDRPRAIAATVDFFLDPEAAVTDQDEWEIMALRHGIFYQGGFPIAVMTQSERNESGHAAHLQGGRVLKSIPGMRR